MDIAKLKDKLPDDYAALEAHVADLVAQRDAALRQSEDGRSKFKKLADERDKLRAVKDRLFERLGLDDDADLDNLPEGKGQAEAARQFDQRIKRLERDLVEANRSKDEVSAKHRDALTGAALEKALSAHEWIDRDVALMLARSGVQVEGDEILFSVDGRQVPLADGVKWLAQTKPHLLKSSGTGGSGYTGKAGSGAGEKNPWAKDTFNLTEQVRIANENSTLAAGMKSAALA
ncbi:MAG: hypothetical protein Q8O34_16645 [Rhodocyclaceae bacterium]|nr:hypothetical protein [Rhodocyclaceae bacterium]